MSGTEPADGGKKVDTANEPVDVIDEEDEGIVDTGVFHEKAADTGDADG
jgi:hypothetical protein